MKAGDSITLAKPGVRYAPPSSPQPAPKRKQVTPVVPQNLKKANSHSELKSVKRVIDRASLSVPKCVKPDVCYSQGYLSGYTESASMWSFFTQWNEVLLRWEGTALSRCVIEVIIATSLGFVCAIFALEDDWTPKRGDGTPFLQDRWGTTGHTIVGSLLAFLTVFRSQIAWSMYLSGYTACVQLRTASLNLARVTIGPLLAKSLQAGELLPAEAAELMRLLKLFWFLTAEHLRSTDGTHSWEWCQHVAYSFATQEEIAEFMREHGSFQVDGYRNDVLGSSDAEFLTPQGTLKPAMARRGKLGSSSLFSDGKRVKTLHFSNGKMVDTFSFLRENKEAGGAKVAAVLKTQRGDAESDDENDHHGPRRKISSPLPNRQRLSLKSGQALFAASGRASTHSLLDTESDFLVDPTRAKPSKVIMWLNTLMVAIESKAVPASEPGGFAKMAAVGQLNALVKDFMALCKVDTVVLPMPYNQLLKINLIAWTFTLPFVIVQETGWFCPFAMCFIASAFFGLDQVGVVLESPFGTDPSDISLLSLGKDLAEDLDVMLRTATSIASRQKSVTNDKRSKLVESLLVEMANSKGAKVAKAVMVEAKAAEKRRRSWANTASAAKAGVRLDGSPNDGSPDYSLWDSPPNAADMKISKMTRLIKEAKAAGVHLHRPTIMEAAESTLKKLKEQMTGKKKKKKGKGEEVSSEEEEEEEEEAEEEEEEGDDDAGE